MNNKRKFRRNTSFETIIVSLNRFSSHFFEIFIFIYKICKIIKINKFLFLILFFIFPDCNMLKEKKKEIQKIRNTIKKSPLSFTINIITIIYCNNQLSLLSNLLQQTKSKIQFE